MKKLFTILLLLAAFGLHAQTLNYNNEWIDYNKTYYKFKIGATGLYRIPQSVLVGAGINSSTPAQYFQLFRNGVQVPVYTSVASGPLGSSDYIEFWAEMNDGKPDNPLYRTPAYQHTDKYSLETDTAAFFLTVNPSGAAFHLLNKANNTTGNVLPVEPYFMYKTGRYFKNKINLGFAAVVGEYVYSSSYDQGEFWSLGDVSPVTPYTTTLNNLFVYTGGPDATLQVGAVGNALNTRSLRVAVNNTILKDTSMDYFNDVVTTMPVPIALMSSSSASVTLTNTSVVSTDRMVSSFYEFNYPRQFNFGGQSNFAFELPAKSSGYYLNITNFNSGSSTPVLYDVVNGEQYVASVSGGVLSFELPGSSGVRKMILVSEDPSAIQTVTSLTPKNFINFSDPSKQGNYIIISNPKLYTGSHGNNPVADYKSYRNSPAGGSFNAQVYDINELIDQFSFGIKQHPLSIRNFLRFARNTFTGANKPQFAFLIGHGVDYVEYKVYESDPMADKLNLVPSFGYPASDNKLSAEDGAATIPLTPIGRLSVVTGPEIEVYLQKVTEYENTQATAPNTLAGREWMKNIIHVTGAGDPYLGAILCNYMHNYEQIITDTLFGGNVTTFCKATADPIEQLSNDRISQLFAEGVSMVTYFGHSSATTLEFNLNNPAAYNNPGKYPVFYVLGCNAGNFFAYDPTRVTYNSQTLSEKYVLAPERGGIAFIASTHFGIVNYLNIFINGLYAYIDKLDYRKTIGEIERDASASLINAAGPDDYYARLHAEEITLHGDPALKINGETKPDYVVEASQIKINPAFISVATGGFTVNARLVNIGKAVKDSITVEVKRIFPNKTFSILLRKRIPGIRYADSVQLPVGIQPANDKGQNYITVTIDADKNVDEADETNNSATAAFFIYEDEAKPIYPYNYAIVNVPNQHLFASTANPFSDSKQYVMELDTTEQFNSVGKISKTVTLSGGILEFDPGIAYKDSIVYYWRVSLVPAPGDQYRWNEFSFIYISNSVVGFNQSHFYQHMQSTPAGMVLGSNHTWSFTNKNNDLYIRQAIYPTSGTADADFAVSINSQSGIASACLGYSLIFNVLDPVTFKPWINVDANGNNLYRFGSVAANCQPNRNWNFEFSYMDAASRKLMMNFMDSVPDGAYVIVRNIASSVQSDNTYAKDWQADTSLYGSHNSLYHKLVAAGFTELDSIYKPRAFAFVYRKGDPTYQGKFKYSDGSYDPIILSVDCPTPGTSGSIASPVFGPAKQWKELHWRGNSIETPSTDNVSVQVIGVDTSGNQTPIYFLDLNNQDYDISAIDAHQYPFVQLKMKAADSVNLSPYQLQYWRLNYTPVPEGALTPNIYFTSKDTLEIGEQLNFGIAFKNISPAAFDSMLVKMYILDHNNTPHPVVPFKRKPLVNGDTLMINFQIDTKLYPGANTLYLDINPDNNQPEQYHFNNFIYRSFYVKPDLTNPLLDVTFDGTHILNRDIVSAKPHIQIKLKDEAKFLLLDDTSLISVSVKYPDAAGTIRRFNFNSDTLRFIPATNGADNTASIDFLPVFTNQYNPEGDEYELIVLAKDKSGNEAGTVEYRVTFKVISKPMISNMLNYPNPFTTSTAFVFTITGTDVPQNIKIQILTVTGKIVREITKDELGPLHIGRNITEFKWDGTDMFGQRLANGVYLYHVVTNLNGKSLDKYKSEDDNTDKYFNNGYGKMYLMR